jgi:hypothetical protein
MRSLRLCSIHLTRMLSLAQHRQDTSLSGMYALKKSQYLVLQIAAIGLSRFKRAASLRMGILIQSTLFLLLDLKAAIILWASVTTERCAYGSLRCFKSLRTITSWRLIKIYRVCQDQELWLGVLCSKKAPIFKAKQAPKVHKTGRW